MQSVYCWPFAAKRCQTMSAVFLWPVYSQPGHNFYYTIVFVTSPLFVLVVMIDLLKTYKTKVRHWVEWHWQVAIQYMAPWGRTVNHCFAQSNPFQCPPSVQLCRASHLLCIEWILFILVYQMNRLYQASLSICPNVVSSQSSSPPPLQSITNSFKSIIEIQCSHTNTRQNDTIGRLFALMPCQLKGNTGAIVFDYC